MRPWMLLVLSIAAGCGATTAPEVDAGVDAPATCDGTAPMCAIWRGACCEDAFFQATCRDGAWVCDPCVLGEPICSRDPETDLMSECTRFARDAPRMGMTVDAYCGLADAG